MKLLLSPVVILAMIVATVSCTSMSSVDRSLVNSPLMSFRENQVDNVAPHTGLKGSGPSASGGCTVCAH